MGTRHPGRMAASNADRLMRQALSSLPSATLTEFLNVLDVDLTGATAQDRNHVLHTLGLIEDALDTARFNELYRNAFTTREN